MKTGKKEIHPEDFMKLAESMLIEGLNITEGLKGRLQFLNFKKPMEENSIQSLFVIILAKPQRRN